MSDLHSEALRYPPDSRGVALDLLKYRTVYEVTTDFDVTPFTVRSHRAKWVTYIAAVICIICGIAALTTLVPSPVTATITVASVASSLVALIVFLRAEAARAKRARDMKAMQLIDCGLEDLGRGDEPEEVGHRVQTELTVALQRTALEVSNRVMSVVAVLGLVLIVVIAFVSIGDWLSM